MEWADALPRALGILQNMVDASKSEHAKKQKRKSDGKFAEQPSQQATPVQPHHVDLTSALTADPRYREPDPPDLYKSVFGVGGAEYSSAAGEAPKVHELDAAMNATVASLNEEKSGLPDMPISDITESDVESEIANAIMYSPGKVPELVPDELRVHSIAAYSPEYLYSRIENVEISDKGVTADIVFGHFSLYENGNPEDYDDYDPYDNLDFNEDGYANVALARSGSWVGFTSRT